MICSKSLCLIYTALHANQVFKKIAGVGAYFCELSLGSMLSVLRLVGMKQDTH